MSLPETVPNPVLAAIAAVMADYYTGVQLDQRFTEMGAPGDPPVGNKLDKCLTWLKRVNAECPDRFSVVGGLIEDIMEVEPRRDFWGGGGGPTITEITKTRRDRIHNALAKHGLRYQTGGQILGGAHLPSRGLEDVLRDQDMAAVEVEFDRAIKQITTDPPAAVTAACAIIESACKVYIADEGLILPPNCTIKPLWSIVQKHLGLDPAVLTDDDLKKVLSGLSSIVDGIGGARTHSGSAHGQGRASYKIQARHARLTVNAAHTLVMFMLETWAERRQAR